MKSYAPQVYHSIFNLSIILVFAFVSTVIIYISIQNEQRLYDIRTRANSSISPTVNLILSKTPPKPSCIPRGTVCYFNSECCSGQCVIPTGVRFSCQ